MATQANLNLAQSLYIAYYGRAADSEGLQYWANRIETEADFGTVLSAFGNSAEYTDRFGEMSNDALIDNLYQQMFDRSADFEGLQFYSALLASGDKTLAQIAYDILAGAQEPDTSAIAGKLAAANDYTTTAGEDYVLEDGISAVRDANVEAPDLTLTVGQDNLVGTDGDDVFEAPIVQNANGAVTNTLESGDVINGGEGRDTLNADLTLTASAGIPVGPAISPTTNDVEVVNLRAQSNTVDTGGPAFSSNFSTVDAERMSGVEEWWSVDSRSDIRIEDVRSNPDDTAIGMRNTDPFVSYGVYFDPAQVTDRRIDSTENSSLTLTLNDQDAGTELENFPVNGVVFSLDGEQFNVQSDGMGDADTYVDFVAALEAELAAQGLDAIEVTLNADNTITLTDPAGAEFEAVGYTWVDNIAPSSGDLSWNQQVGAPTEVSEEELIGTTVVLDGVGRTDQGGLLDIGSMGAGGVDVFNVLVQSDSWLSAMESRSNLGAGDRNLEEVMVVEGSEGDLTVGSPNETVMVSGLSSLVPDDGRVFDGLTDVRVVDASELDGSLRAGITLTDDAVGRYLDDADGTVDFSYTGTANDDILAFEVDEFVTDDPDFAMQIDAGDGDDLVILGSDFDLVNVSLEGGAGEDTLETSSDIGTETRSIPAAFAGFENLVLTGSGTDADMAALPGIQTVTIATGGTRSTNADPIGGGSSTVENLAADTDLTITGERQTLGNGSNNDQDFGIITLTDAQSETQQVDLVNTARVDGELTVTSLVIDGPDSNVNTLEVASNGGRNTSNVVQNIVASSASSVLFAGTQDLAAHVSSLATGAGQELTIDGSELEGDLTLAVNAGLLVEGADDVITGTEGENDTLALYGASVAGFDTSISGFETIQLGWNTSSDLAATFGTGSTDAGDGTGPFIFDTANTTDVEQYIIALRGAGNGVTLDNLSSGANVQLGVNGATTTTMTSAPNVLDGSGELNLSLADNLIGNNETQVNGFSTVNFDVAGTGGSRFHNLVLDADGDVAADALIVTGGSVAAGDALVLTGELPASLGVIDFSEYQGTFDAFMGDSNADNSDTRFVFAAEENAQIDLAGSNPVGWLYDGINDWNAIFEFTGAPAAQVGGNPAVTWTIDGFVSEAIGGNDSYSILDLSAFGIESFADLDFTDVGIDVVITAETANPTWEIVLTGVQETDLAPSENFIFA